METIIPTQIKVVYEGKDITRDIVPYVITVDYTDSTEDESDDITITLEDSAGLWRSDWMPKKGDKISLSLGYQDEMLECGKFTIDEIEMSGPPDTVTIRALAASISQPIRTKNSKAFEKQTLRQIAQDIAGKYGYNLIDENTDKTALDDIVIDRITQSRETDLSFLRRVSKDYGIMFSLRDTDLVFTSIYDIEKGQVVLTIDRKDLTSYSVRDKAVKVYKDASVTHVDPYSADVIKSTTEIGQLNGVDQAVIDAEIADSLNTFSRADNTGQADKKSKAALHKANSKGKDGTFSLIGNPRIVAGINFELTGLGRLSGQWHITKSTHTVSRSGYKTDCEAKLVKESKSTGKQSTIGDVLFDTDSAVIRPAGFAQIDSVVTFMLTNSNAIMEVGGHTDSDGSAAYNLDLSTKRATAVMNYMVQKGVFATRLTAKGYGERRPIGSNSTAEGKQMNRRTEFVVVSNLS